MLIVAKTVSRK